MSFKPKSNASKSQTNDKSFQISKNRFISVNEFKGKTRVDVREYYESNGEQRPGKKGISLSLEEWKQLIDLIPKIEKAIKGIDDSDIDSDSDPDDRHKKSRKTKKSDSELDSDSESDNRHQKSKPKKKSESEEEDSDSDHKKSKRAKKSKKSDSDSD